MVLTPGISPYFKLSPEVLSKWQETVNVLANTLNASSVSITRHPSKFFKTVSAYQLNKNPITPENYQFGENSYCQTVIHSTSSLSVSDENRSTIPGKAPGFEQEKLSYIGIPVFMHDRTIFGMLSITHCQTNPFSDESEKLLLQFKETIESDLASLAQAPKINNKINGIKNSSRTLSTLINNLPGIVYRCANDANWTMEYINGDCLSLTGYSNEDIEHNRKLAYADLIHPDDQEQVWMNVQKGLKNKEPFKLVYRIITSRGRENWVSEQGCGIYSEEGELEALEGFITDINDKRKVSQELEECRNHLKELERSNHRLKVSTEDLKHSNRELEEFAFLASHDLQEPLRKINIFSSFIQSHSKSLNEKCKDYFRRMVKASERMQGYVDDLLQLSRVISKAPHLQRTDLNKILQDAQLDLNERITSTRAEFQVESLPLLKADPIQMKLLFQNILSNSLEFQKKGVDPIIKVSSQFSSNGGMEIIIEDNGIGIHPENRERIFKPFERVHGRTDNEGKGIGLALCKKIITRHGWKIKVEGVLDQGTKFLISLPPDLI